MFSVLIYLAAGLSFYSVIRAGAILTRGHPPRMLSQAAIILLWPLMAILLFIGTLKAPPTEERVREFMDRHKPKPDKE